MHEIAELAGKLGFVCLPEPRTREIAVASRGKTRREWYGKTFDDALAKVTAWLELG